MILVPWKQSSCRSERVSSSAEHALRCWLAVRNGLDRGRAAEGSSLTPNLFCLLHHDSLACLCNPSPVVLRCARCVAFVTEVRSGCFLWFVCGQSVSIYSTHKIGFVMYVILAEFRHAFSACSHSQFCQFSCKMCFFSTLKRAIWCAIYFETDSH